MSVGCDHGFQLPFLARVSLFRKKNTTDDTKLMNFFFPLTHVTQKRPNSSLIQRQSGLIQFNHKSI